MWFLLVPFVLKEPCSRPGDPDIALQSNVPRCLLSPTSNEMPNSQLCPDISGYATSGIIWRSAWKNSGALWTEDTGNSLTKSYDYGPDPIVRVRMRAGAYDSTYGSSSSVSVAAVQALIIIKL